MNCYEVQDVISSYIEKELSIQGIKRFDEHIDRCKNCHKVYEGVVSLITSLRTSKRIAVSDDFNERLQERIRSSSIKPAKPISQIFRGKMIFGFEPKYAIASIASVVAIVLLTVGLLPTNDNPSFKASLPAENTPVLTAPSVPNNSPQINTSNVNFASDSKEDSIKASENDGKLTTDFDNRIKLVKDQK